MLNNESRSDAMNELKLCIDCKHHWLAVCGNEKSRRLPATDFVNGGIRPICEQFHYCVAQRIGDRDCGESGKWFEPKETA